MGNEILIIGGGFAGLAAGVALADAGQRVRLLEQKPHLGGRARSFIEPLTGSVVDNGQHLIMGCYGSTLRFLKTIGTLDRVHFQAGFAAPFLEPDGKQTELRCAGLPAPWHLLVGALRSKSFSWREKLELVQLGLAFRRTAKTGFQGSDGLTVDAWLARLGQSESLRRNFWDLLSVAAMNEDPRVASAAIFERVLRLALFSSPLDSRLGIPRGGLSECYTQAARDYITARHGRIELNRDVHGLLIQDSICRGVLLVGGETVQADRVVSAVPWHVLTRLLPPDLLRTEPFFTRILSLRPAPIISINLWLDRPVAGVEFAGLRGTTIQWLFNKGGDRGGGSPYLSIVLSGAHAHIATPKEELLAMALSELKLLLPAAREAKLRHSLIIKERFATFSPCVGVEALRPSSATPIRGLLLAGDWTATGLPATIEGAVQSGYTAAEELVRGS